jgi:hypothetical protein
LGSAEFGRPGGTHDFGYAQHDALDSTRATHGPSIYDHIRTTRGSGALPVSPSGFAEFDRLPGGALDSTRATRGPSIYDHSCTTRGFEALLAPPSGCARATVTASTSVVTIGEGYTGGTSGQSSSDDHAGEAGLLASG